MASKNSKSKIIKITSCRNLKLCITLLFVIIFASCQSTPGIPDLFMEDANFAPLDTGASVYIFADVNKARSIIELLPVEELQNAQTRQMLDRTSHFAAAMFPGQSGKRFQLAASGNYPSSRAGMALTMDRNWKEHRVDKNSYWHSGADRLSIAMSSRQAFVMAMLDDTPREPFFSAPGMEIPEGFNDFRRDAPMSCWLENSGSVLNGILSQAGLPLRFPVVQFFINLFPAEEDGKEGCIAVLRFQLENAAQARGMAALLALAGNFASNDPIASIFLANAPVQNGQNLDIKTAMLGEEDILRLFAILLN
ncbi:MAG: hypothetical protein FWD40_08995 [Treponema sp.]|nr:hypothetical protein [Treponema sp.]